MIDPPSSQDPYSEGSPEAAPQVTLEPPPPPAGTRVGADGIGGPTPIWLWLLALTLFITVAVLQSSSATSPSDKKEEQRLARGDEVPPPGPSPMVLMGKFAIMARETGALNQAGGTGGTAEFLPLVRGFVGDPDAEPAAGEPASEPADAAEPWPASERVHLAIVAAELAGPDEAIRRFEKIHADLSESSPLQADLEALRAVYQGHDPDDAAKQGLLSRHGWFGRIALSYNDPKSEPARQKAVSEAMVVLVLGIFVGIGYIGAFLLGLVMLVLGLVWLVSGKLRPAVAADLARHGPGVGRRLWLETFTVFVGSFLLLKVAHLALEHVAGESSSLAIWGVAIGQWLLVPTLLWPLVRGVRWGQLKREIGWHTGRGAVREIGAGILGYCASLPLLIGAVLVGLLIQAIYQLLTGEKSHPPASGARVSELLGQASPALAVALGLLMVVWAPVVEESIFRGALYRHFRLRLAAPLAAILVGIFFALMHSYAPLQLMLVCTLGISFCLMREWRGSLLPSMTAHFIQNAMALTLTLIAFRLMQP